MIDPPPVSPPVAPHVSAPSEDRGEDEALSFDSWIARGTAGPRLPVLPDGSPPGASAHPISDQARVFNQDGFFAAASPQGIRLEVSAMPAAQGARDDEVAPDLTELADRAFEALQGSAGRMAVAPRGANAKPVPAARVTPANPVGIGPTAAMPSEPQFEPSPLFEGEILPTSTAGMPARAARAQTAFSVAIRDIERGLQILVVAQALSGEERERLANEIAALLSRHGLVPRDVRIAGPSRPPNSGKR